MVVGRCLGRTPLATQRLFVVKAPCGPRRMLSTLVHGKPAPAPHGAHPSGGPQEPFKADTAASKRLFRLSVAGFAAFAAYVGFTAYDGYYSAKARTAAEEAVLAIPLYKGNPVVYLDFSVDNVPQGRVVIQLRKDVAPRAAENFRALCTGEKGYGYHGCRVHSIVPGQYIVTGDYQYGNGEGGASIYGEPFPDEVNPLRHIGPGILSMTSRTPNENNSTFFISLARAPIQDGRYMVFGNVVSGMEVLHVLERLGTWKGATEKNVRISGSGQLKLSAEAEAAAVALAKAEPPAEATATTAPSK